MFKCPKCGCENVIVVETKQMDGKTKRRRRCLNCNYRFNTMERVKLVEDIKQKEKKQMGE